MKKNASNFLVLFGKNIAAKRKEKGLSQEKLSFDSGLDVMTISRIERGLLNISVVNMVKIAVVLNIHPKEFLEIDFNFKKINE